MSVTRRHGGGVDSRVPVSSGEAGEVEGSEEDLLGDMHTPVNHLDMHYLKVVSLINVEDVASYNFIQA